MKNILILVDVQNGFIRNDKTMEIAKKIVELSNSKIFDYIIATKFLNFKNSLYQKNLKW